MPVPVRRAYGRERQYISAAGNATLNVTRPAGAVVGDWIVTTFALSASTTTLVSGTGWSQILLRNVNTRSFAIYARQYKAGDAATYPITFNVNIASSAEIATAVVGDADIFANWVIGTNWRRQDNGGNLFTTQSPGIVTNGDSLVLAIEMEATNAVEADGSESIVNATKWFGSPTQATTSVDIERVLVSYIEMESSGTSNTVTTTWPNSSTNGSGMQIAIPYLVGAPPTGELAHDTFNRTIAAGGWGNAEAGGLWSVSGTASYLSVSNGKGLMSIGAASGSVTTRIASVLSDDIEINAEWSVDKYPTVSNIRPRFITRNISGVGDYHVRGTLSPAGVVDFRWYKDDAAAIGPATITLSGTYTPGTTIKVRAQTFPDNSSTRLRAKMWFATDAEPSTWTIDILDGSAGYQAPGSVGLATGLGAGVTNVPVTMSYDNFYVTHHLPDGTSNTGNIDIHLVPYFTQTSLRVGAKFNRNDLPNTVQLYDATGTVLIDTKTPTISSSKWGTVDFTGLTPNTTYKIRYSVDGIVQIDASHTIRTLIPAGPASFTIVAGSCQFTGSTHPVFTKMLADSPRFIAHMGDLQYANATDETAWRAATESSFGSSTMKPLLESVPIGWTWDNHDRIIVDTLNLGTTSPATVTSWHELAGTTGWSSSDTMGRSWTSGRVRFIQTDQWSVRDDPDLVAEPRTFLGATQKQWFKDTLLAAQEPFIVWFCQWTAQNHANGRWNSFSAEVTELENWLNAHPSVKERLIMVGGDSHQLQADSGRRTLAQGSRFAGVPSLNVSGFNRSSTGANGGNWDIGEADIRTGAQAEADWGAYSRMTFVDDGLTIDMLWEAVRVSSTGTTDILASWRRRAGTVEIGGKTALAQYYRSDQTRIQPLAIEKPQ